MTKFKFTGVNIAAAILVLFYFFPWVDFTPLTLSGASITSKGISPGFYGYLVHGLWRLFMILALIVPVCGGIILYQNVTGNNRFSKYYKPAHFVPLIYFVLGIIGLYVKMKPEVPAGMGAMYNSISDMEPGVTDVLSVGVYICLIASLYLLLVGLGKVKDKEYYKPATGEAKETTVPTQPPPSADAEAHP